MKQHKRSSFLWLVVPLVLAALLIPGAPIAGAVAMRAHWKVVPTYDSKLDLNWICSSHGKEGYHPRCASRLALL